MRTISFRRLITVGSVLVCAAAGAGAGNANAQSTTDNPGNPTVLQAVHGVQTQVADLQALVQGLVQKIDSLQSQAGFIPPAWAEALPGADRFVLTMGGEAVLDRETGLVWEQSPGKFPGSTKILKQTFEQADCVDRTTGGRRGWRLPTVWELSTLIDPVSRNPALPPGHPFDNVSSDVKFWTATPFSVGFGAGTAWVVSFDGNFPGAGTTGPDQFFRLWCVRAPGGVPPVAPTIQ